MWPLVIGAVSNTLVGIFGNKGKTETLEQQLAIQEAQRERTTKMFTFGLIGVVFMIIIMMIMRR